MSQDRYSGYSSSHVHAGGTLALTQLRRCAINNGKEVIEVPAMGDIDRKAVCMSHANPEVMLKSADLATVFGTVSPTVGLKCNGTSVFRYQLRADGGVFDSGNTHLLVSSTSGFLCVESVQAQRDDANDGAFAELKFYPQWGGLLNTAPLIVTTPSAIGGTAPAFGSQFFMGPVYLGSTELENLISCKVEFGLAYTRKTGSGDPWARRGSIYKRRPVFTFVFEKLPNVNSAAMFTASVGETLAAYFWKGAMGSARVAVDGGVHCKVSATAGEWGAEDITVEDEDDATTTIRVSPTNTVAVAVNSNIP